MAFQQLRIPVSKSKQVASLVKKHKMKTDLDYRKDGFLFITFRGSQSGIQQVIKVAST